ncbi:MAG: hypothetical protein HZA91_19535 [Verrucomicrobia bacterium]|nr:hypothetical protein [Verrucomicrobiota bacterium]
MKKASTWAFSLLVAAGFLLRWQPEAGAGEPAAAVTPATNAVAQAKQLNARRHLEAEVEKVRGLKFLRPVEYATMQTKDLRGFLVKKLRQEYSAAELRDYGRSLAMIGLVPEDLDFEATMMEVLGEQVAALYDQDSGRLFTFSDSALTGNMGRMILAHEMTHALQDQHYEIKKWPIRRKDNDDLVAAHMAVLEGDATLAMTRIFVRTLDWKTALADIGGALLQNVEKYERAPRYFRESLLFPYQEGMTFLAHLESHGGPAAVAEAFRKPPTSTSQILHPERFHPRREEPLPVEPAAEPSPKWRLLTKNVVGEFGVTVLLREFGHSSRAAAIAAGWRGDRYVTYDTGDGNAILWWRSVWSSGNAARKFADAYKDIVAKRNTLRKTPLGLQVTVDDCTVGLMLVVPAAAKETGGVK